MANTYVAPNFNINVSCDHASLVTLKGGAVAATDVIWIAENATLTADAATGAMSLLEFYFGDNSAGTAAVKTGKLIVENGVVITLATTTTHGGFNGEGTTSTITINGAAAGGTKITCTTPDKATNYNMRGCVITATYTEFEHFLKFYPGVAHSFSNCLLNDVYTGINWAAAYSVIPTTLDGCEFKGVYTGGAIYDENATTAIAWGTFFHPTRNQIKLTGTADGASAFNIATANTSKYIAFETSSSPMTTVPTWNTTTGIHILVDNANGTMTATWNAATNVVGVGVRYRVYVRAGSAPDSFGTSSIYYVGETAGTAIRIGSAGGNAALITGSTYYVIVRAVDEYGNEDTNTTSLNVLLAGPDPNILAIKGLVSLLVANLI